MIRLLAAYAETEELINIGAYAKGSNQICDVAIGLKPQIDRFLQQHEHEQAIYPQTCRTLLELAALSQQEFSQRAKRPVVNADARK